MNIYFEKYHQAFDQIVDKRMYDRYDCQHIIAMSVSQLARKCLDSSTLTDVYL